MTESDKEDGEPIEVLETPQLKIEEYPDFVLPMIECLPFQPPWEDWPAWPPPPTWKYPEPFDAMHEACQPHKLPPNIEMAYGAPLLWLDKPSPKPPKEDLPVREHLMAEKVYNLVLEAMKLTVVERPERPVKFVALYIQEKNPQACKVKCRRHSHLGGETCHCKNLPPPLPPTPELELEPEEGKEEREEEEAA